MPDGLSCRQGSGADAGILKGRSNLCLHAKGGPALGPMLKSLHRGPKGGGVQTQPQHPGSAPKGALLSWLLNVTARNTCLYNSLKDSPGAISLKFTLYCLLGQSRPFHGVIIIVL